MLWNNLVSMMPQILTFAFAINCILNGWRILQNETFTMSKQIDPLIFFPEIEEITLTGKAARFMGYETMIVGMVILALLIANLVFRFVDTNILIGAMFFGVVISGVFAYQKGYSLHLENQKGEPD